MSDDVTWRDHVERWRHRLDVLRAWISFWRALSWRRRNALWISWTTLESDDERAIYLHYVVESLFDAWHAVRRRVPPARPKIVRQPGVMGGVPMIQGTRIRAMTIAACLAHGYSEDEIRDEYPTLPPDSVDAVRRWVIALDELEWQPRWMRLLERDPGETDSDYAARQALFGGY